MRCERGALWDAAEDSCAVRVLHGIHLVYQLDGALDDVPNGVILAVCVCPGRWTHTIWT
jgi:hypothetical protein